MADPMTTLEARIAEVVAQALELDDDEGVFYTVAPCEHPAIIAAALAPLIREAQEQHNAMHRKMKDLEHELTCTKNTVTRLQFEAVQDSNAINELEKEITIRTAERYALQDTLAIMRARVGSMQDANVLRAAYNMKTPRCPEHYQEHQCVLPRTHSGACKITITLN